MKRQAPRRQGNKGQAIIEVLIALTIAVALVSTITISAITSLQNAQYSKDKNLATQYAQEGMEIVRRIRNADPYDLKNADGTYKNGTYCLGVGDALLDNPMSGTGCGQNLSPFIRKVILESGNAECAPTAPSPTPAPQNTNLKVSVIVQWYDGKCGRSDDTSLTEDTLFCNKVKLESCVSDYES